jgi:LysM repeat protein
MRPLITVTAVVLLHLCVIAVLVGVNGCRSTSGFEQTGDLAAYSGGVRPAGTTAGAPVAAAPLATDRIPTPVPTKLTPVGPVGNGGKRTVVKGETLMSIATSEKVTRADLAKANGLTLNADLKAGQVLTIPAASKAPVKAAPKAAPKATTKTASSAVKTAPATPAPTFAPFKLVPVGKAAEAAPAPADKK